MKRILLMFFLLINTFFCFSKVPDWINNLEKSFPSKLYIRTIGEGNTVDEAKNAALSQLSSYFSQRIKTNIIAEEKFSNNSGTTTKTQSLKRTINVDSDVELFSLQYTESYYNRKSKTYSVCVYINRNDAWNILESKLENYKYAFTKAVKTAENEEDNLKKVIWLSTEIEKFQSFLELYDYALVINYENCKKYDETLKKYHSITQKIVQISKNTKIKIDTFGDDSGRINSKVSKILSDKGFVVSDNESEYQIFCNVKDEILITGEFFTCYPSVNVIVKKNNLTVSSYAIQSKKVSAYNEQTVKRLCLRNLEDDLDKSFLSECLNPNNKE